MAKTVSIDIWVLIDEDGEYAACAHPDNLAETYDNEIGGSIDLARRKIKVTLSVPLPETVELKGAVPAEGAAELTGVS